MSDVVSPARQKILWPPPRVATPKYTAAEQEERAARSSRKWHAFAQNPDGFSPLVADISRADSPDVHGTDADIHWTEQHKDAKQPVSTHRTPEPSVDAKNEVTTPDAPRESKGDTPEDMPLAETSPHPATTISAHGSTNDSKRPHPTPLYATPTTKLGHPDRIFTPTPRSVPVSGLRKSRWAPEGFRDAGKTHKTEAQNLTTHIDDGANWAHVEEAHQFNTSNGHDANGDSGWEKLSPIMGSKRSADAAAAHDFDANHNKATAGQDQSMSSAKRSESPLKPGENKLEPCELPADPPVPLTADRLEDQPTTQALESLSLSQVASAGGSTEDSEQDSEKRARGLSLAFAEPSSSALGSWWSQIPSVSLDTIEDEKKVLKDKGRSWMDHRGKLVPALINCDGEVEEYSETWPNPDDSNIFKKLHMTANLGMKSRALKKEQLEEKRRLHKMKSQRRLQQMSSEFGDPFPPQEVHTVKLDSHLRPAKECDLERIRAIYNDEVSNGHTLLDIRPVRREKFEQLFSGMRNQRQQFIVACKGPPFQPENPVIGFALVDVASRGIMGSYETVAKKVGKITIVVDREWRRQKIGSALMEGIMYTCARSYPPLTPGYQNCPWVSDPEGDDEIYQRPQENARVWDLLEVHVNIRTARHGRDPLQGDEYKWVKEFFQGFRFKLHSHRIGIYQHTDYALDELIFTF